MHQLFNRQLAELPTILDIVFCWRSQYHKHSYKGIEGGGGWKPESGEKRLCQHWKNQMASIGVIFTSQSS